MWTLFITRPDWAAPLRIDGYTSKDWAERAGQEAVTALRAGHFWATKLPGFQPTESGEESDVLR